MDSKLKKQFILNRTKRKQIIHHHALQHEEETRQIREQQEAMRETAPSPPEDDPVWSARMQEIRDRLTSRKRMARERWNRFSGTSDAGGMGR